MGSFQNIIQKNHPWNFKSTHQLPLYRPDKDTNPQACLVANQIFNSSKVYEIEYISKAAIEPEDMEEIRTTDTMSILKGSVEFSRNLLLREAAYDTARTHTSLTIQ